MESGSELSKTAAPLVWQPCQSPLSTESKVATFIVQKLLLDESAVSLSCHRLHTVLFCVRDEQKRSALLPHRD